MDAVFPLRRGNRMEAAMAVGWYHGHAREKRNRIAVWILLTLLVLLLFYSVFFLRVRPILKSLAVSRASTYASTTINNAVGKVLALDSISYDTLMSFDKDENGNIIAVKSNTAAVNKLKYDTIREIQNEFAHSSGGDIGIPLGNIIGGVLFTNRGPRVNVRVEPIGSINAEIKSVFSSAGINQTHQQIMLNIDANITIIMPSCTVSKEVLSSVCIADTVIVGSVPGSYVNIDGNATMGVTQPSASSSARSR